LEEAVMRSPKIAVMLAVATLAMPAAQSSAQTIRPVANAPAASGMVIQAHSGHWHGYRNRYYGRRYYRPYYSRPYYSPYYVQPYYAPYYAEPYYAQPYVQPYVQPYYARPYYGRPYGRGYYGWR